MVHESETLEPSTTTTTSSSLNQVNDQVVIVPVDPSPSPSDPALSRSGSSKRLNAQAPEFVPRITSSSDPRMMIKQIPGPMHVFPSPNSPFLAAAPYQNYGGGVGGGFREHDVGGGVHGQVQVDLDPVPQTRNGVVAEDTSSNSNSSHKILNQVEYYFSDANLATTDHLMRYINKDPEGFVPISVVASFKKIKALISSHSQLAAVLQKSSKLIVSDDRKKVRRLHPLTESDMEELQSRIIIAENLPEDHSHQNLMRIFSTVGCVKTIRTCQPQPSNGVASAASRMSKLEHMLFSNKLHAFVEYETVELAEKAVVELNDEKNWRSSLRVRLLLKQMPKPSQPRGRKSGHEGEGNAEENVISTSELLPNEKYPEDSSHSSAASLLDHIGGEEGGNNDKEGGGGPRRGGRGVRGRGKGRGGRGGGQSHNNNHRGNNNHHIGTPPSTTNSIHNEQMTTITKQPPGPRMPDGTRGFAMGRGKPVIASSA